jgi:hypothetical protein
MAWYKIRNSGAVAAAIAALIATAGPAAAEDKRKPAPPPKVLTDLLACRQIADPAARLACYDAQTTALAAATERSDIVVADREQVEKTRRGLFGYAAGEAPLLGVDGAEVKQLDTKVSSARLSRAGGWVITMAESGTWEQTDSRPLALSPKPGQKVAITKGSLGSYFVSVDGQPAIKMRRIQ